MDAEEVEEDEAFGFSRSYLLAKEKSGADMKSASKISDIEAVEEQELKNSLASLPLKHEDEVLALLDRYKESYPKWLFHLRCGFGILMHGFGSKKGLIENFASTALTEYSVLVVNGYLQSVNLKQVVVALTELWWGQIHDKRTRSSSFLQSVKSHSMDDLLSLLNEQSEKAADCFVCLVVHNIDGPALRDTESQQVLAQIASCSNVRIIASIDHINTPLLWDKKMARTQFNWCWFHVPTFAPYKAESMFFPLILNNSGKGQSAKTATIVLQSLTPNAQGVFKVLAEYQLSHPDEQGMTYDDLYSSSRERFLVSSQVTLNSHLTEFKDHEIVKVRKNSDGQDCLYIPIAGDALEKVLHDIN